MFLQMITEMRDNYNFKFLKRYHITPIQFDRLECKPCSEIQRQLLPNHFDSLTAHCSILMKCIFLISDTIHFYRNALKSTKKRCENPPVANIGPTCGLLSVFPH